MVIGGRRVVVKAVVPLLNLGRGETHRMWDRAFMSNFARKPDGD